MTFTPLACISTMKCCSRSMQTMSGFRVRLTRNTMTRSVRTLAETVEIAVQLRRCAEEEFALQVQKHHPLAAWIVGLAVADHAVRRRRSIRWPSIGRRGE